ncbi:MAG TPA: winged helix-turn-helix domain-containing protein [Pyrinomonadaceae bacterium]|nr:winged helix-turn-helix domain-containing protein [Pyrinomonadaceae bacterium]
MENRVFQTLLLLVKIPQKTISKSEFIETIWEGAFVEEGNLSVAIAKLRKALKEKDPTTKFIETVPRRGYRFKCAVIVETDEESAESATPPEKTHPAGYPTKKFPRMIAGLIALFLAAATIVVYLAMMGADQTPELEKVTITNPPDNKRQFFVRIDGDKFVFETVRVRVIGMDCSAEDPCEVPNDILKKFSVIKNSSLEHVPLTLPTGEFQIMVQNGDSAMSNPLTIKVP